MRVFDQTIKSIVDDNYIYARALSQLGIEFYLHPNKKLGEVCAELGLVKDKVLKSFYLFDQNFRLSLRELEKHPLPIVIQYLKHTHGLFIKTKLPYIAKLIAATENKDDLKLIFPVFVEDFIKHIHEEEDTVFEYINRLTRIEKGQIKNPLALLWKFKNLSLVKITEDHESEDHLFGIRMLIDTYTDDDLCWKVICKEIRAFDREMMYHAQIENDILLPRAVTLEKAVHQQLKETSLLN